MAANGRWKTWAAVLACRWSRIKPYLRQLLHRPLVGFLIPNARHLRHCNPVANPVRGSWACHRLLCDATPGAMLAGGRPQKSTRAGAIGRAVKPNEALNSESFYKGLK